MNALGVKSNERRKKFKNGLIRLCKEINGIPMKSQIIADHRLMDIRKVRVMLKRLGYKSIADFCLSEGFYDVRSAQTLSEESIYKIMEEYREINGRYPTIGDFRNYKALPTWAVMKSVFGDKFGDFKKYHADIVEKDKEQEYNSFCQRLIKLSEELGTSPTGRDLVENGLPSASYFVKYCKDKNVDTYSEFILSLGLLPNRNKSKEEVIDIVKKKSLSLNRNLCIQDFNNPQKGEVGIRTIRRVWGSFNNMLIDLKMPINQEDMVNKSRTVEDMMNDIVELCARIENLENRRIISKADVDNCDKCLSSQTYHKIFSRELGLSLAEFIKSIGYDSNKQGMGMNYVFEDGERTGSQYEFQTSTFLREKAVDYQRDVKYKDFIVGYNGHMDCDYIIPHGNNIWYIEIAGMLNEKKSSLDSNIHKRYKKNLYKKEEMLKDSKVKYKIIYPKDFQSNEIDEVFSFLFE